MEFSHVALNCKDLPATIEFYSTHFGFKVSRRLPIGEGKEIIFLYNGSVYLELFPTDDANYASTTDGPNTTGIIRHFAFKAENVDNFIISPDSISLKKLTSVLLFSQEIQKLYTIFECICFEVVYLYSRF